MKFTPAIGQRIAEAIKKVAPKAKCPLCQTEKFTLANAFFLFPVQNELPQKSFVIGGPGMPCVAITCTTCGNTFFLNIFSLGLADLMKPEPEPKEGEIDK